METTEKKEEQTSTEVGKLTPFAVTKDRLTQLANDYKNLVVTKDNLKEANEARLVLYRERISIQGVMKKNNDKLNKLKSDNKEAGEILIAITSPIENRLKSDCDKIETAEENRKKTHKRNIESIHSKVTAIRAAKTIQELDIIAVEVSAHTDKFQEFNAEGNEAVKSILQSIANRKLILEDEAKAEKIRKANEDAEKKEEPVPAETPSVVNGAKRQSFQSPPPTTGTYRAPSNIASTEPEKDPLTKEKTDAPWENSTMEFWAYQGHNFGISKSLSEDERNNIKDRITEIIDNLEM